MYNIYSYCFQQEGYDLPVSANKFKTGLERNALGSRYKLNHEPNQASYVLMS